MKRRYDLTVYLCIKKDCICWPIFQDTFYSMDRLVRRCIQFSNVDDLPFNCTGDYQLMFDVFDSVRGQFNINDLVERFKV